MTVGLNVDIALEGQNQNMPRALSELVDAHYDTLKRIARSRRRQSPELTLQTTDILHEAWLRLRNYKDWNDEEHFVRTIARAIRFVVVDQIRERLSQKRGGGALKVAYQDLSDVLPDRRESPEEIVMIDLVLDKLSQNHARVAETVNLRYFAGFTENETASILGISERTVRRDWIFAKAWLATQLSS